MIFDFRFVLKDEPQRWLHLHLVATEINEKLQTLYQTQRNIQKELTRIHSEQFKLQSDLKKVYNILYPGAVFKDNTIFVNWSSYAQGTITKSSSQSVPSAVPKVSTFSTTNTNISRTSSVSSTSLPQISKYIQMTFFVFVVVIVVDFK